MAEEKSQSQRGTRATSSSPKSPSSASPVARTRTRIYIFGAVLCAWMLVIGGRLVALQVVRYGELSQRAARQQLRTVEVSPRRGIIYDRNGHELAMTINVDSVFAVPSQIPDPANTAGLLARILKVEPREVLARIEGSRSFVWIARKVEPEVSDRIRKLNLKGIYFEKESKRFYPKRELAAQVLGYVGLDDEGLGGIERAFEEKLKGRPGKMMISVDARQRWLGRAEKQPEPGNNVVLTIDEKIQYIAERELGRAIEQTKSEAGTIVVQNPKTGEILALANWPTFNPNAIRGVPNAVLKNRAVTDVHEPGSTFKIITIAAALEEKLTTPEEVIDCQNGSITIFGHKIRDHKPFGLLTVSQVMQQSSDVGTIKLGLRLGEQRFDEYIRAFGFGAPTGVELPGETRGMAKPAHRWTKNSIGAISMGQEIGVSSMQLVSMVSAIANEGVYVPPRIVAGTLPPRTTPQTVTFTPPEAKRIITPLTAVQIRKMLEDTVLFGTGKKAILNGYTSAGKTGTAQKYDPATGTYSKWKHIASFGGFAPVNKPAVTITVMLDSPVGEHHGGEVAAPVFARVAQQVLAYMNVPHDTDVRNPLRQRLMAAAKTEDLSEGSPDRLSGEPAVEEEALPVAQTMIMPVSASKDSRAQLERAKVLAATFKPDPKRVPPPAAAKVEPPLVEMPAPPPNGTVVLDVGSGPMAPHLLGKTVRAAIEAAQDAGVEIDVVGTGVARSQSPLPGQRVATGTRVVVHFAR